MRRTAIVNHFYFYGVDDDFGPFFIKFGTYFPHNAKVCINGSEWAKRQATKAGAYTALDNGFAACDDHKRCNASATGWTTPRSTGSRASGWPGSRTPTPPRRLPP